MPRYTRMNSFINAQVKYWSMQKEMINSVEEKSILPFITISREYGSGGYDIAEEIVSLLNEELNPEPKWAAYDKKLLEKVMDDMGLSSNLMETLTNQARKTITNLIQTSFSTFPPQVAVFKKLVETERILATNGHVVLVGRAGNVITKDLKGGFHIRIIADLEYKTDRISEKLEITKKEARKVIETKEAERNSFLKEFVKFDLTDPHHYHLIINNARYSIKEVAKMIIEGMKIKGFL